MSTPKQIREFAAFHWSEAHKTLSRSFEDMEAGNYLVGGLRAAVAGRGMLAASTMDELADEVERHAKERKAHAETRKRLLKLQWRGRCREFQFVPPAPRYGIDGISDKGNRRAVIAFAAKKRVEFHDAGRGVPR